MGKGWVGHELEGEAGGQVRGTLKSIKNCDRTSLGGFEPENDVI